MTSRHRGRLASLPRLVLGFIGDHPTADLALAVSAGVLAWFIPTPILEVPLADRAGIYSSASSMTALVGGLGSLAVAAYSSGGGRRVSVLRAHHGSTLVRNFAAMLGATFASAGLTWSAQIVTHFSVFVAWSLAVTGLVWASLTVIRQTLLFGSLMLLSDQDQGDRARPKLKYDAANAEQAARARSRGAA